MAKGYGWAATGVESDLLVICFSIKSICPMSLSLLEIMESNFLSNLCKAHFICSEIVALFSGTFL